MMMKTKNIRLENLKKRSEKRKVEKGSEGMMESYENDPGVLLLVRSGRLEKLDDVLRRLGHLMGTHLDMDILDEKNGYFLINVKESGWGDNLKRVISFISKVRSFEAVMVRGRNAHGDISLLRDINRMKVIPSRGVSFGILRESFLRMTSQFILGTNMQNTKEGMIIHDLRGIDFFETIALLEKVLNPCKAIEAKKPKPDMIWSSSGDQLSRYVCEACETNMTVYAI